MAKLWGLVDPRPAPLDPRVGLYFLALIKKLGTTLIVGTLFFFYKKSRERVEAQIS